MAALRHNKAALPANPRVTRKALATTQSPPHLAFENKKGIKRSGGYPLQKPAFCLLGNAPGDASKCAKRVALKAEGALAVVEEHHAKITEWIFQDCRLGQHGRVGTLHVVYRCAAPWRLVGALFRVYILSASPEHPAAHKVHGAPGEELLLEPTYLWLLPGYQTESKKIEYDAYVHALDLYTDHSMSRSSDT